MAWSIGGFLSALHRIISPTRTADWDASGLQLGDPGASIELVGVCHEVTETAVNALQAEPVDLLITYHPLLFRPTTRVVAGRSPVGRAFSLLRAGVALAVTHTSFDAVDGGTADALATTLSLEDIHRFGPVVPADQIKVVTFVPEGSVDAVAAAMSAAGAGQIGNYSSCSFRAAGVGTFEAGEGATPVVGRSGAMNTEPEVRLEMTAPAGLRDRVCAALVSAHPYEEPAFDVYEAHANMGFIGRVGRLRAPSLLGPFAERVGAELGVEGLRVSGDRGAEVGKVAVIPGSGGSFVTAAVAAGADVLVTGDVGHHTVVQAADAGLAVVDVGHAPSERPGMRALAAIVAGVSADAGAGFRDLTVLDPTPWR